VILGGDIGGTNTRLAVFELADGRLRQRWKGKYRSREHDGLVEIVRAARLDSGHDVEAASFGVAGPVVDGQVRATNLPWVVDARRLAAALEIPAVGLINDLEAHAWGLALLAPDELVTLHAGDADATGNAALVSPGTGLGEAGLFWDGERHLPFATEGGHASFAPADELQVELLRWLGARHGRHVSWERVLSGPGLHDLYRFLCESGRGEEPAWLAERLAAGDPSAAISAAALEGKSPLAERALDLFVALFGAEAGNVALKVLARGGVYLGGGIAPKIDAWFERPVFLEAFLAKGRMRPLLESMPVWLVLQEGTALLGAARHAAAAVGHPVRATRT
jgi:glucokinase